MTARDMKFQADLSDSASKKMDGLIAKVKAVSKEVKSEEEKQTAAAEKEAKRREGIASREAAQRIAIQRSSVSIEDRLNKDRLSASERMERQRIALQRSSIALMEKQKQDSERKAAADQTKDSVRALRETKSQAEATTRIQTQAAIAQSSLVADRFDRRIAIEKTKHSIIMQNLRSNDAAQEAEIRRHMAVVSRIQMDKANLPSTPFQRLLGILGSQGSQSANVATGATSAFKAVGSEVLAMTGPVLAGAFAFGTLAKGISTAMDSAQKLTQIKQLLDFAAGSAKGGAEEFEFIKNESLRLGLALESTAEGYSKLAAVTRGTVLQGKATQDVFVGVAEAAATFHLSGEQVTGTIKALTDMIGKGKVSAEELKGQLGDRLPGAMDLAAKAMGKTTAELYKMMEKGQLLAVDFLPKFGEQLHKTFGSQAVVASESARGSIQKLKNEMFLMAASAGEPFINAMGAASKAILKIGDAYDAASVAANKARKEAFNDKILSGKFANYGDNAEAQTAKAGSAMGIFQKKLQETYDKAHPKVAAAKVDTVDQIASQVKLEDELQVARAEAMRDGEAKKLAQENMRYNKEKNKLLGSEKEKELLEAIHLDKLRGIYLEYQRKRDNDAMQADDTRQDIMIAQSKKAMDWTKKDIAERQQADEDEKQIQLQGIESAKLMRDRRTEAMAPGKSRQIQEMEGRQQDELAAFNLSEEAKNMGFMQAEMERTLIAKKYSNQRKEINRAERDAIVSASVDLAGNVALVMANLFAKDRTIAKLNMRISQMTAIANVAQGVTKAYAQGGVLGFISGAAVAAAGAAQVGTIEKQINRFATGTDYSPGGMAIVGENGPEMVHLPKGSRVNTAPETQRMMGNRTQNHIEIHMAPGVTQAEANMVADAVGSELDRLAENLEKLEYMGKRRGYRSRR